jgi:hypothetical protein
MQSYGAEDFSGHSFGSPMAVALLAHDFDDSPFEPRQLVYGKYRTREEPDNESDE